MSYKPATIWNAPGSPSSPPTWRCVAVRGGELDLIMREGKTWVFVEVRYRRNDTFGGAAASVTYRKQQRLLHAAAVWLAGRGASFDTSSCRFDVLAITGSQLEWIPNAFNAD